MMRFRWNGKKQNVGDVSAPYGVFELTTLPGCSQVVVSHDMYLSTKHRGKGLAKEFAEHRYHCARYQNYDAMICTVDTANIPQIKTLEATGWQFANRFVSSKTGHTVAIYTKVLNDD